MSPTNLDALANENPELREPLRKLNGWLRDHSDPIIVPSKVARQLVGVDAHRLAVSLMLLVRAGLLKRVFKVLTPSGSMADGEFTEIAEIPERMPDRFNNFFNTSEADVIPVFKREQK